MTSSSSHHSSDTSSDEDDIVVVENRPHGRQRKNISDDDDSVQLEKVVHPAKQQKENTCTSSDMDLSDSEKKPSALAPGEPPHGDRSQNPSAVQPVLLEEPTAAAITAGPR